MPSLMPWIFLFSFRQFRVLGVTHKSLIHFEVIFIYGMNWGSNFILPHVDTQFCERCLLKHLPFYVISFWHLCCRWADHRYLGLFLGSLVWCIVLVLVFVPVPYCFTYYSFVTYFEIKRRCVSGIVVLKIVLTTQSLSYFLINHRVFSISTKILLGFP